jgi:ubiquinone/menaquinone biosynthesis C-methylase UbiE
MYKNNNYNKIKQIWDERYLKGGNSGCGSYGLLCEYKAEFINSFIKENKISNIIEFGSGDGNQANFIDVENYTGVDISEYIINICKQKYKNIVNKHFFT